MLASLSLVTTANGALVDFETVGELAAHFNSTATVPAMHYNEAAGVGVGGSGGLNVTSTQTFNPNVTNDAASVYKTQSIPFTTGSKGQVSILFHTVGTIGTTGETRVLELNLVAANTNIPTAAHTGIGGKIEFRSDANGGGDDVFIRFRRNNSDVASSLSAGSFDIQPNNWYKATFTATSLGPLSTIPASMVLDDYGATGTTLVDDNVFSHSFNIPIEAALTADTAVFGAFRVRNGLRLYNALDNFAFGIPEPTTVSMLGLAAAGLLALRRRS
jgi:hypothetical protein